MQTKSKKTTPKQNNELSRHLLRDRFLTLYIILPNLQSAFLQKHQWQTSKFVGMCETSMDLFEEACKAFSVHMPLSNFGFERMRCRRVNHLTDSFPQ